MTVNRKEEATGANRYYSRNLRKKFRSSEKEYFLHGEVFFLLTGPLMGDPQHSLTTHALRIVVVNSKMRIQNSKLHFPVPKLPLKTSIVET